MSDILQDMYGEDLKESPEQIKARSIKRLKYIVIIAFIILLISIAGAFFIHQRNLAQEKAENIRILSESIDKSLKIMKEQQVELYDNIELIDYFDSYETSDFHFYVNPISAEGYVSDDGLYGAIDFPSNQLSLGMSILNNFSEINISKDLISIEDNLFLNGNFAGSLEDIDTIEEYLSVAYGLPSESFAFIDEFLNTPNKKNDLKITSSINDMIEYLITNQEIHVQENVEKDIGMASLSHIKILRGDRYSLTINKEELVVAVDNLLAGLRESYSLMQSEFDTEEEYNEYIDNYINNNLKPYIDTIIDDIDNIENSTIHFYIDKTENSTLVSAIEFIYNGEEVIILLDNENDDYLFLSLKYAEALFEIGMYHYDGVSCIYAEQYDSKATKIVNGIRLYHDATIETDNLYLDMILEEQHILSYVADLHVKQLDSNLILTTDTMRIKFTHVIMEDDWLTHPETYDDFSKLLEQFKALENSLTA